MADIYVRSTTGNDGNGGTSWADAKATLVGAAAIDAAGDTIWLSQAHSETTAASVNPALAGTAASPQRILCGNDGAGPPTALATGATIQTTGINHHIYLNDAAYVYGLTLNAGDAAYSCNISTLGGSTKPMTLESCTFQLTNSASTCFIGTGSSVTRWVNCSVKFGAAGQKINSGAAAFEWNGGGAVSGTTTPTALLSVTGGRVLVQNVDLSNFASTLCLFAAGNGYDSGVTHVVRNCKLPASWSGTLTSGTMSASERYGMYNCDSSGTNYRLWIEDYAGTIRDETTLVRTGGASDGTTPLSWKLTSSANAKFPLPALRTDEIVVWNDTSGSSKTVTVEILHDSATALNNDEIWLEVEELGTSGYPLGVHQSNAKADVLASAAAQTTSSATWTTTGMSNPNKQKLAVTFTPQNKGPFLCRVVLAKASYTVYVDPVATVS